MSEFYDNLDKNTKQVFDILKYQPTDDYDANNYLIKRCKLNDSKDIFINLKKPVIFNGKPLKFVKITAKKPFMACVPEVWQSMKTYQQLKAIIMIYNYLLDKQIGDRPNKPTLMFFSKYKFLDTVAASSIVEENYIYFPLHRILYANNCIQLTSFLVHEIEHFRQNYDKLDLVEWLKQNDYDFSKLTKDQKHLFFRYTNHIETMIKNLYDCRSEQFYNYMINKSNLTKENIDLWIKLEEEKNLYWIIIKQLAYAFCDKEVLSQDIEMQALRQLYDTFGTPSCKPFNFEVKRNNDINILKKGGFEFDEEAIQNITNLGYLANMVDIQDPVVYFDILNYLLEVYKAKRVDKPFMNNYDDFEDAFFKSQQKVLLKQRENELEQGSETNEL